MKKIFLLALLSASIATFAQKTKKEKPPLDGRTFEVTQTATTNGKSGKGIADQIVFKSGKVKSPLIEEKSMFDAIKYTIVTDSTATDEDGNATRIILFEAEGTNDKQETIKWSGTVTGPAIEGTAIISKKEKVKKEYAFTGNEKLKK